MMMTIWWQTPCWRAAAAGLYIRRLAAGGLASPSFSGRSIKATVQPSRDVGVLLPPSLLSSSPLLRFPAACPLCLGIFWGRCWRGAFFLSHPCGPRAANSCSRISAGWCAPTAFSAISWARHLPLTAVIRLLRESCMRDAAYWPAARCRAGRRRLGADIPPPPFTCFTCYWSYLFIL